MLELLELLELELELVAELVVEVFELELVRELEADELSGMMEEDDFPHPATSMPTMLAAAMIATLPLIFLLFIICA